VRQADTICASAFLVDRGGRATHAHRWTCYKENSNDLQRPDKDTTTGDDLSDAVNEKIRLTPKLGVSVTSNTRHNSGPSMNRSPCGSFSLDQQMLRQQHCGADAGTYIRGGVLNVRCRVHKPTDFHRGGC
jgi:hypothetical protein